jgi:hypothetical protein
VSVAGGVPGVSVVSCESATEPPAASSRVHSMPPPFWRNAAQVQVSGRCK